MKREELIEAMARAIYLEMGPVFGTPEYLARPGNVERLQARQQSAAEKWAEAALSALEALGMVVVPRVATEAMLKAAKGWAVAYVVALDLSDNEARGVWTAMLTASQTKDSGHD